MYLYIYIYTLKGVGFGGLRSRVGTGNMLYKDGIEILLLTYSRLATSKYTDGFVGVYHKETGGLLIRREGSTT